MIDYFNMNFETEYKNLNFRITLEKIVVTEISLIFGDKFHKLPNQTMSALKKGKLAPYNLIIISNQKDNINVTRIHYWSNVLLANVEDQNDDLLAELGEFLDHEEVLDSIVNNWNLLGNENGPAWSQTHKKC